MKEIATKPKKRGRPGQDEGGEEEEELDENGEEELVVRASSSSSSFSAVATAPKAAVSFKNRCKRRRARAEGKKN